MKKKDFDLEMKGEKQEPQEKKKEGYDYRNQDVPPEDGEYYYKLVDPSQHE